MQDDELSYILVDVSPFVPSILAVEVHMINVNALVIQPDEIAHMGKAAMFNSNVTAQRNIRNIRSQCDWITCSGRRLLRQLGR